MSEIYNTGLLKEQSKLKTELRVDEKERQGFDRFLKGYMPESEDMTFRTVRDAKRNFEIIERCRSLQRDTVARGFSVEARYPFSTGNPSKSVMESSVTMGVKEMCIGLAVASYISWIINAYYTGKLINIGFLRQTVLVLPTTLYTLLMWASIEGVKLLIHNYLLQLLVGIAVGVAVYYLAGRLLKSEELAFVERKAREQFASKAQDNH